MTTRYTKSKKVLKAKINNLSKGTLLDVLSAYSFPLDCAMVGNLKTSRWTQAVEPTTMNEVKDIYESVSSINGSISLMNVFNEILKVAEKKHKVTC